MRSTQLIVVAFLASCASDKTEVSSPDDFNADTAADADSDADTDVDADTDTDSGEPPEPETSIDITWTEEGVTISIENGPLPEYQLGMLDTLNEDGWRGEDCLNGMAGYTHCHPLGETGGTLATVFDVAMVEPGVSTRHTRAEGAEGALTYALLDAEGNCLVAFGNLPDYYISSVLACPAEGSAE